MTDLSTDCPDFAVIGGYVTPGILDTASPFPGLEAPRKWDERKGYGTDGSTVVYAGAELAKFSIKGVLLPDPELGHWYTYDLWMPAISAPPTGASPKALDLVHPIPNMLGIRSIVVVAPVGLTQTDDGVWTWELKVIEYRAPKPKISKPKGSAGSAGAKTDPLDDELDKVRDQLKGEGDALDRNLRRVGV